jgi:hypothetical protein
LTFKKTDTVKREKERCLPIRKCSETESPIIQGNREMILSLLMKTGASTKELLLLFKEG